MPLMIHTGCDIARLAPPYGHAESARTRSSGRRGFMSTNITPQIRARNPALDRERFPSSEATFSMRSITEAGGLERVPTPPMAHTVLSMMELRPDYPAPKRRSEDATTKDNRKS